MSDIKEYAYFAVFLLAIGWHHVTGKSCFVRSGDKNLIHKECACLHGAMTSYMIYTLNKTIADENVAITSQILSQVTNCTIDKLKVKCAIPDPGFHLLKRITLIAKKGGITISKATLTKYSAETSTG